MRREFVLTLALGLGLSWTAAAQAATPDGPPPSVQPERGAFHGDFQGIGGEITAIDGSIFTLKTFRGEIAKVKISSATRLTKDREEATLADFKVGTRVMVAGEQDSSGIWQARMMGQRSGGFDGRGARGGMAMNPADNGKTFIAGEVTKIDGLKLTVRKPDGNEQVIAVDEDTSFRSGRESVTLADVKVGQMVHGQGAVKDGIFLARELNAGGPRGQRGGMPPAPPAGEPGNSNGAPPAPPAADSK